MMLGYLGFLALIFLPGSAVTLVLGQERGGPISLLARSYGLSLVLNSLVGLGGLFVGVSLGDLSAAYLLFSLLVIFVFLAYRYKFRLPESSATGLRGASLVLLLGCLFGALVLSEFLKYPVFPKSYSVDFIQHATLVQSLLTQGASSIDWMILYGGVHVNLAMGASLAGGSALVQLPILMALLTAPSSLLFYEVGMALYGARRQALLTQALYTITGFVWYVPLYDSGLYPNLFGTILSLFFILLLLRFRESMNWKNYLLLLVTTVGLYLSHYSVALFIIAIDAYLVVRLLLKKERLRFVGTVIVTSLAPASAVLTRPDLLAFATGILSYGGPSGSFPFTTPLADALSSSSFLQFVVAEIYSYEDVALLLFTLPIALYYIWSNRNRSPALLLIAIWLGVLWATAPQSDLTWRFSNQALAPLIVLAPASFDILGHAFSRTSGWGSVPKGKKKRPVNRIGPLTPEAAAAVLIILIVFAGSWANAMMSDLATDPTVYSSAQVDLYHSMLWFNQSTPAHSSLLSVTDWRVAFMQQLTGRTGGDLIFANATQAVSYAKSNGFGYILVTYLIPLDVPAGFDAASFYNSFSSYPGLKQVYSNPTDVIYQVVS